MTTKELNQYTTKKYNLTVKQLKNQLGFKSIDKLINDDELIIEYVDGLMQAYYLDLAVASALMRVQRKELGI